MLDMEMCLLPQSTLFVDLRARLLTPDDIQDLVIMGDANIKPELCENVECGNVPITSDMSANLGAMLYHRRHLCRHSWWTLSTEEMSINELTYLYSSLGPLIHNHAKSNHTHPHQTPELSDASAYSRTHSYSCCVHLLVPSWHQRTRGMVIPQSWLSHGLDNRTSSAGSWFWTTYYLSYFSID